MFASTIPGKPCTGLEAMTTGSARLWGMVSYSPDGLCGCSVAVLIVFRSAAAKRAAFSMAATCGAPRGTIQLPPTHNT